MLLQLDALAKKKADKAVMYKVNKIYQRLNIEGDEPEEADDEE